MATWKPFKCFICGYEKRMSGKPDYLRIGPTVPMECLDCHSVFDQIRQGLLNDEEFDGSCPECEGTSIRPWDYRKKPCPRCKEGRMKIDPEGGILMAD